VLVVGTGFFGGLVASRLAACGLAPLVVARRSADADVRLDAEDEASLRAVLRTGDVIVDTAGPFAARTTRLVRIAMERGCDVVDLAESLAWSEAILALAGRAQESNIRVYPACSAVAAVAGACVRASGIAAPESIDMFLAPASAETASPATVRGFIGSLGRTIRTFRDGRLSPTRGYIEERRFPNARHTGGLVESAAAVLLPRSWPGLRRAEFWVDPNLPLGHTALALAARVPPVAALARAIALRIGAGPLGRHDGVFAVSISGAGRSATFAFAAPRRSYYTAIEPAVMAGEALARGATPDAGVVLPDAQVDPEQLFTRLAALGIATTRD
jgi:hypothetical protein